MKRDTTVFGAVIERPDIRSSLRPFFVTSEYTVTYPDVVIRAIDALYREYNGAFGPLRELNREWDTDYQYARAADGSPVNFAVQVDVAGLDDAFLARAATLPEDEVRELMRRHIFEIENSIAMYHIFGGLFEKNGESRFMSGWRAALDDVRKKYGKPIALLACTHEKYGEMLAAEFDKTAGRELSDKEVREMSGFDRMFGPDEFRAYLDSNGGACEYLLFIRSSDPIVKLKRPDEQIRHPLLDDPETRRVIKENALTFNIDDPSWHVSDPRHINDTKAYMMPMNMAFAIKDESDVFTAEFSAHLARRGSYADFAGSRLSPAFVANLIGMGIDADKVERGELPLRFKPMLCTYGCYGHISGVLSDVDVRRQLRKNLQTRGTYVVQQEIPTPAISDGEKEYTYMDRIFLSLTNDMTKYLGGFRLFMPLDSQEAKSGRNHGSRHTIWAEINNESRGEWVR